MYPIIAKGALVASILQNQVASKIKLLMEKNSQLKSPKLAVLLVGQSPASASYVKRKIKISNELGIQTKQYNFPLNVTEDLLVDTINNLNLDNSVDGILVQLPLPSHINKYHIIHSISQEKDVDCLHSANQQKLLIHGERLEALPCTPAGVIALLDHYKINVAGLNCTIVGRSHLVGQPLSFLMMNRNSTVTLCHRETQNLQEHIVNADIVISAAGQRHIIKGSWIKLGSIIIDVGINQSQAGDPYKIVGDVEFDKALERCSFITPVPGGVGPMTICRLMVNLQNIWCKRNNLPVEFGQLPENYLQDL